MKLKFNWLLWKNRKKLKEYAASLEPYENRKIGYVDNGKIIVSTIKAKDKYETAISHPDYADGELITVELYNTEQEARDGHSKWFVTINDEILPEEITNYIQDMEGNVIMKEQVKRIK
jgi:hypothetical protein